MNRILSIIRVIILISFPAILHGQNIFRFDPVRILGKISLAYYNEFDYAKAKEWGHRYYKKMDKLKLQDQIWANFVYALLFKTPNERIRYMKQLRDIDSQMRSMRCMT
jgi:hypothetical protein